MPGFVHARTLMAYSGITIPMAAMGMPVAVYLPRFYTEGLGLSLVIVGTIFTLARIWNVITDPVMGIVIDKFDTRWGRRVVAHLRRSIEAVRLPRNLCDCRHDGGACDLTTTNKVGAALAVGASFAVLELAFGFVPGGENTQQALDGLLITYTVGTAVGLFLAYVSLIGYPLNKAAHEKIRQQLETRAT